MTRSTLKKYWWAITSRGLLAILFAIFVLFWTKGVLELLILMFGLFVLASGLINIFSAFGAKGEHDQWWVYILKGIFEIVIGIITFTYPAITAVFLVYLIAIWALILGIVEMWLSSTIIKEVAERWVLTTMGIFSIIIAILFFIFPLSSIVTITWLIGLFALISGIGMVIFGLEIKR